MVATPITPSNRYYRPGTTKIYVVETIADTSAPSRTELDAGTDISGEVQEVTGFMVTSESVPTPDFGARFVSQIPGPITAPDSSLIFYADTTSADIRATLSRDDDTHIVFLDEGDVPTQLMDVYPVRVASVPKLRTREDPARIQVDFTVTSEPDENVAIPATP